MQKDVLADLRRNLSDQEQSLRSARSSLEGCKQARVRHDRRSSELRIAVQKAEDLIDEITEALDKESVEDGRIDVLQTTLEEAEEEKRLNEGSLQDGIEAMDAMMEGLKAIKHELSAKEAEVYTMNEELRLAQNEAQMSMENRRRSIREKNAVIERISDSKKGRTRIQQRLEEIAARILDFSEKASLVSPRVAIAEGETAASLDKKLDRLHTDLRRYNQE